MPVKASGSASVSLTTANGIAGIGAQATGTTTTETVTASGTAVVIKGFRRHMVPLRPMQPISSTLRPFLN